MFSGSAYIILYIYKITHLVWPKRRTCTKLCHLKTVYSNRIHINRAYYMYPHFMYRYMYRYTEIIWYIRYTIRYSWSLNRHAPYRARVTGTAGTASASGCSQSSTFSSSFETFLNNSANLSGSDGDTSYANEDRDQVITGRYIR